MATHELKCWPSEYQALVEGLKTYEIRKQDRPFRVGDTLYLREWEPSHRGPCDWVPSTTGPMECFKCHRWQYEALPGKYTGRETKLVVTYITSGGNFGLPPDVCVMSVRPY